ncbi:MAG TPA: hypothetical protein VJ417_16885, partial [Candidatus Glassbacteria bacterium]|nr:hypothetical protein [Candidatus Glassbacteria bacterium]
LYSREARDTLAVLALEPVEAAFADSPYAAPALVASGKSAERAGLNAKALAAYLQYLRQETDKQYLSLALERGADLLYQAGRVEEAAALLNRIAAAGDSVQGSKIAVRTIAIGCQTGLGRPDSALRLAEEIRRSSGDSALESLRLRFMLGHAHLALDHFLSADSLFESLIGLPSLRAEGITSDSLYSLLLQVDLRRGNNSAYFRHAVASIRESDDPERSFALLRKIEAAATEAGAPAELERAIEAFKTQFGNSHATDLVLVRAGLLADSGRPREAMKLLDNLDESAETAGQRARVRLARARLLLAAGDTLRTEAEIRDYLAEEGDPLHDKDSLLWVYAGLQTSAGRVNEERALLEKLISGYPASRWWQEASQRVKEIRLFQTSNPRQAADELLDIYQNQAGQVPALRLAEIAAEVLGDYDRALAILQQQPPEDPAARLKLIRYRFLSGLARRGTDPIGSRERIAQSLREIRSLLGSEKNFHGRETAVSACLEIYRALFSTLSPSQVREIDGELRAELGGLDPGGPREELLCWLASRYTATAEQDSGMSAMALVDSARTMWSQAIDIGADRELTAEALYSLASSLENALFAGATDSAAGLYGKLLNAYSGSRWASLAGLRLGVIHLNQDRFSLAYRTIADWAKAHPYATDSPAYLAALAEASFLTGRYALAIETLNRLDPAALDNSRRRYFEIYRVRALTRLGDYSGAESRLVRFRHSWQDETSRAAANAVAVELYYAAGSPALAQINAARIAETHPFAEMARAFALQGRLALGGEDLEKLLGEFERLRKSPWNPFFREDLAFAGYRGIMACNYGLGKLDRVSETRDDFRKSYPERRAALCELMLDEVEYLLKARAAAKAATLYDDVKLLFGDVFPEDRFLWVGWKLATARADVAEANRKLTTLAEKHPWSRWGQVARSALARLYLDAGRIDQARSLVEQAPEGTLDLPGELGMRSALLSAENRWPEALELRRRQWSAEVSLESNGEIVLLWAQAAMKAAKVQEATDLLSVLWNRDPELTARARLLLADQYRASGYPERTLDCLEGIPELFAGGANELALQALFQKGMTLEGLGRVEEAVGTYRKLESLAGQKSDWLNSARTRLRNLAQNEGGEKPGP